MKELCIHVEKVKDFRAIRPYTTHDILVGFARIFSLCIKPQVNPLQKTARNASPKLGMPLLWLVSSTTQPSDPLLGDPNQEALHQF